MIRLGRSKSRGTQESATRKSDDYKKNTERADPRSTLPWSDAS